MFYERRDLGLKFEKTFSMYAPLKLGIKSRSMSKKKRRSMDLRTLMTSGRKNHGHSEKKKTMRAQGLVAKAKKNWRKYEIVYANVHIY